MSEEKINIAPVPGTEEMILRKGDAIKYVEPTEVNHTGTLKAPFQYIQKKLQGVDARTYPMELITEAERIYNVKRSHILINRDAGTLELSLNEKDPFGDTIAGRLTLNEDLKQFCINEEKFFSLTDVIKLIKRNKFKFANADKHGEFLVNLQNFNAKVTTVFKDERSNQGNSLQMVERVVAENKNAPAFKLNMPIYKGYDARVFEVQTCLDATSGSIRFYFESVELYELIDSEKQAAINAELALFTEHFNCSVLEV